MDKELKDFLDRKMEKIRHLRPSVQSSSELYQVYINGQWIADCDNYEEAETIANAKANEGEINIEMFNK